MCASGEPNLVVNRVLSDLASSGARMYYHGAFDWPGVAIANRVMARVQSHSFGVRYLPYAKHLEYWTHGLPRPARGEVIEQLMSALAEVGLEPADDLTADPGADLVVRGRHGVEFAIEVKHRALVRDSDVPTPRA